MVLVEGYADKSDESAMVLGCSDIIVLMPPNANNNQAAAVNGRGTATVTATAADRPPLDIQNLTASLVSPSSLFVTVRLSTARPDGGKCTITLSVYAAGRPVAHHRLNCTTPWTTVGELPVERSYQVCASIGSEFPEDDEQTMACTSVDGNAGGMPADWFFAVLGAKSYAFLLSATFTALMFLSALLAYKTACRACSSSSSSKKPIGGQTHQCFLPVPPPTTPSHNVGTQRPRYVKLQATTVL